jgi:hypothetical protein
VARSVLRCPEHCAGHRCDGVAVGKCCRRGIHPGDLADRHRHLLARAWFRVGLSGGMRALFFISGILSMLLGLFAFSGHEDSIFRAEWILAIFIGIAFLFQGFGALFAAAESRDGRGWNIFGGIVLVIAGIVVLVVPLGSLFALAVVVGIWLIIMGIFALVSAFSIRAAANRLV